MDMSVQVESEDQEDIVTNTPSKRRTRAMRIIDYDEESAVEEEEEEEEADNGEEDAEGVHSPPHTAVPVLIDPVRTVRSGRTGVRPGIGTPNSRCIEVEDQTQASSTLGVGGVISTHLTRYGRPANHL